MSLYDEEDEPNLVHTESPAVTGWAKSVSWMQSQQKQTLAAKKAASAAASAAPKVTGPSWAKPTSLITGPAPVVSSESRPTPTSLAPVMNLKKNKPQATKPPVLVDDVMPKFYGGDKFSVRGEKSLLPLSDPGWTVVNEYDPLWPNDYHKVVDDIRESKRMRNEDESSEFRKRRYTEASKEKARERFENVDRKPESVPSGFARRPVDDYSDEDEDIEDNNRRSKVPTTSNNSGAAIAPPPSLMSSGDTPSDTVQSEDSNSSTSSLMQKWASTPASTGLGVAAKIMAKYGYKQGQGLGKSEQGMSMALSVEKTSKRGGRILHEKDFIPPPPLFEESSATLVAPENEDEADRPSITELLKNPTKVVLCKNMVGPGEVDPELEPEVKEECHTKYGEVNRVLIYEMKNVAPEEAVRIFIEFKRVESAIKAVVGLNGRFFGGREVTARFYDVQKFQEFKLSD